ncbi:eukaryotic translation initiation factor [Salix suchowensis]|nr:eukaryotic translation initiation factor [Salix suchowensis]
MEKKLQKLVKTMDYLERAKREEAAPLIEAAFQQRLVEEKALHEHEQQQEIELSRQRHDGDLKEKNRLSRILENKIIFEERVQSRREAEFNQRRAEREERINQIIQVRKQEREALRKKIFFVRSEEEILKRLREEEEARKLEETERRRKEEAERKAKLDEIAEKQRQRERELEEKERLRREALLVRATDGPSRSSELPAGPEPGAAAPAAAAAAAAPAPGKYVPEFRLGGTEGSAHAQNSARPAPSDTDRWSSARQPPSDTDRWSSGGRFGSDGSRPDDRNPPSDKWGGSSKSTWSSSRLRGR